MNTISHEQENSIRSRVKGRQLAVEMFCLVQDDANVLGPIGKLGFLESVVEIAKAAIAALNPPEGPVIDGDTDKAMNDAQAKKFGGQEINFGVHAGKRIDEVPIGYLLMLVDENEFKKKLRRYLASPRIKAEMEQTPFP